MAEGSESKAGGEIIRPTRSQLLAAAAGALTLLVIPDGPLAEFNKPNVFKQKAINLWDEYEMNPEEFKKKNPHNIEENLTAGPTRVNLRDAPSAQSGTEGITGFLNPYEPVGIALVHPEIKPDPFNGSFLIIKKNNQVYFVARKELINLETDTIVQLTNKP